MCVPVPSLSTQNSCKHMYIYPNIFSSEMLYIEHGQRHQQCRPSPCPKRTPPLPLSLPLLLSLTPQHSMGLGQQGVAAGGGGPSNGDGGMGGGGGGVGEHNVKAEPALGAAALERVVAAAKAAHEEQQRSAEDQRAVCDLCNVRRADLRGPCGHKYHARESPRSLLLACCCVGSRGGVGC